MKHDISNKSHRLKGRDASAICVNTITKVIEDNIVAVIFDCRIVILRIDTMCMPTTINIQKAVVIDIRAVNFSTGSFFPKADTIGHIVYDEINYPIVNPANI